MKRFTVWRPLVLALSCTCALAGTASAAVTDLSIDPTATLSPGHLHATVTGSITCDRGDNPSLQAKVVQPRTAIGFGFTGVGALCDGTPQPLSVDVSTGLAGPGAFKPGKASAELSTTICDFLTFTCSTMYADDTIRLTN